MFANSQSKVTLSAAASSAGTVVGCLPVFLLFFAFFLGGGSFFRSFLCFDFLCLSLCRGI